MGARNTGTIDRPIHELLVNSFDFPKQCSLFLRGQQLAFSHWFLVSRALIFTVFRGYLHFSFLRIPEPTRFSHSSSRFSMSEACSTIGEERLPAKPHSFVISSKAPSGRLGKSDM